ncbi:MAG: hypothetical protein M1837_006936 [Sclerophora amabilis]|nr:MAG: hypothetical protein M1837_006936 [Sclerophora amabilis]
MSDSKQPLLPAEPPPSYEISSNPGADAPVPSKSPARPPMPRAILPLDLPVLSKIRTQRVILASASPRRKQLLGQVENLPFLLPRQALHTNLFPNLPPSFTTRPLKSSIAHAENLSLWGGALQKQVGLSKLEIIPSTTPENLPKSLSPFEYVLQTATQKAETVYRQEIDNAELGEPALIIAADTVVVSHLGEIMEKPRSEREHSVMLRSLRDEGAHKVYTAVAVMAPLESAKAPGYAVETAVEETMVLFDKEVTDDLIAAYIKTREGIDKAGGYGIQGVGSIFVERIEGSFDNVVGLPMRTTLKLIEKVVARTEDDQLDDVLDGEDDEDV